MRIFVFLIFLLPVFGAERPNVILFVTDDQSPVAGCYGNSVIKTPNLDALAKEGTMFTQAFATTASCSASRSVILSGLHNHFNSKDDFINLLFEAKTHGIGPLSEHSHGATA
ncbi:sulfatase-like hydrolase/transferase [Akkermansiaceae bacterium]|nr:sulfatase-like hydrolase/transferase [Akkermansiaceae bacterium]